MGYFNLLRLRRTATQGHLNLMAAHLLKCADTIDELRAENKMLLSRGNRLAEVIDNNDWTMESAYRLCDAVAAWREFSD